MARTNTHRNLLWTKRARGREGWYLPEHFSAEWDHVNYEPYSEGITNMTTGAGAAGAFTEKSNIFHIGMVSVHIFLRSDCIVPVLNLTTHDAGDLELHAVATHRKASAGDTRAAVRAQYGGPGLDLHRRDEVPGLPYTVRERPL